MPGMPSTMPWKKMIDKGGTSEQHRAKTSRKQQRWQEVAADRMPSMIRKQSRHPFSSPQRKHLRGVEKGLYFYPKAELALLTVPNFRKYFYTKIRFSTPALSALLALAGKICLS
jgi:hypothetical protein